MMPELVFCSQQFADLGMEGAEHPVVGAAQQM
jgi:hypothetical protein